MPIHVQDLNLVLCGPMLRRVTGRSVAVFVALKAPRFLELTLHSGADPNGGVLFSHSLLNQALVETVPLGKNLHVALVELDLTGTAGLFPGQLYGYNVLFRENNDPLETPADLSHPPIGLINDTERHIGCAPGKLPCFSLPPLNFDQFNLIHGSCRKPHGGGKDMLAALDDLLQNQDQYEDSIKRPHLLLLTGDQIYADDVAPPLLRALHDAAKALLGWREVFAGTAFPGGFDAQARNFQQQVFEKNTALEAIIAEVNTNGFTAGSLDQIRSLLADFSSILDDVINSLPDKNIFKGEIFYLEYAGIEIHLNNFKERLTTQRTSWENAAAAHAASLLPELENYFTEQKALDGYLDFFQELASDHHWGQIEVKENPPPVDPPAADPDSEAGKRLAARNRLRKQPLVLSRISPPQRANELREFAGMTSDAMDAHLMFLGEFYMMYLFTWSDEVWPVDEYGQKTLPFYWESVPNYSLFGSNSKYGLIRTRDHLLDFGKSLPKVRRVLANIPTLMIFDDHEVTDDWNLNEEWVVGVNDPEKSPFGAQLLRNALAAYAVFQDWGNRPEDYAPQTNAAGRQILNALAYELKTGETQPRPAVVDSPTFHSNTALFDLFSLGEHAYEDHPTGPKQANTDFLVNARLAGNAKTWHWQFDPYAGTGDSFFRLTALDTRTWRGFPNTSWTARYNHHLKEAFELEKDAYAARKGPAALIHPAALSGQLASLSEDLLNIVVSPAPVFGLPLLEDGFQRYLALSGSVEEADYEAWAGNSDGFTAFKTYLAGKTVALLSGDVHYAYTNYIEFPGEEIKLAQLCSSSMKNETALTEALGIAGRSGHFLEFFNKPAALTAVEWGKIIPALTGALQGLGDTINNAGHFDNWWDETAPISPISGEATVNDQALIKYYLSFKDYTLFNFEMLLPNGLWELGSGMGSFLWNDFLWGQFDGVYERDDGDRAYVVHFLKDYQKVENGNSPERLQELQLINNAPEADILAEEYEGHWDEMREIVGYNNFGRISFKAQTSDPGRVEELQHRLHWQIHRYGETEDLLSCTLHQVSLQQGPMLWENLKRELIQLAEAEYAWWNPQNSDKIYETLNGQKNPVAHKKLRQYYRVPGLWAKYLNADDPDNLIWGAVFLSCLIKMAGGKNKLPYSERCIDLMRAARRNREENILENPFWLYDLPEYTPEPGDILFNWRETPFTYQDIDPNDISPQPAQCAVVVAKENDVLTVIEGNLSHSVGKRTITLNSQGKIPPDTPANPTQAGAYIAVLKIWSTR